MDVAREDIQRVIDALVRDFGPRQVILFGSRAYGQPRAESDVDLLVVLAFEGSTLAMMSAMLVSAYGVMRRPFPVEVHPRRPLAAGNVPDAVMREAMERGVVLYERAA